MTGEQKTQFEQWFEGRSVRLDWLDAERTRAKLRIVLGLDPGGTDPKTEFELPGVLLTEFSSVARHLPGIGGKIFAWLPRGWPNRRTVCIASSRIGRLPEIHPWWTAAIRTAGLTGFHDGFAMMTGEGMTAGPFVRRMAHLLNMDLVDIRFAPQHPDASWFRKIARTGNSGSTYPLWIFSTESELPDGLIDTIAIGLADSVRVIKLSDGGNVFRAVQQRLQNSCNDGSVWLLSNGIATSDEMKASLAEQGAIQWLLTDPPSSEAARIRAAGHCLDFHELIIDLPNDANEFLAHWTRARGRHPGIESEQERLDRLLFETSFDSGGAFGTLLAIVCSRRLRAGSALTRDTTPMISFTEVPLSEFPGRRVFRSHLGRWDFELFGIAIRKSVLQKMGARPVFYGGDSDWTALPESDRPFFQFTRAADSGTFDWRAEMEWRLIGDLDLARLDVSDMFVFVADREAAEKVAGLSRWPIAILPLKNVLSD